VKESENMSASARQPEAIGAFLPRSDEAQMPEKSSVGHQAVDAQIRQVELVLYRDVARELLRRRPGIWLRVAFIAPWGIAILFWFFALKSVNQQQAASLSQGQTMVTLVASLADQNKQFTSLASSLQTLAAAVVSSSAKTRGIEERLERSRRDLRRVESKLQYDEMQMGTGLPNVPVTETQPPGALRHHHEIAGQLQPGVQGAQIWRNNKGKAVYWLMPREMEGLVRMVKVLPVATDPEGVVVHDVDDGEDYVVTPSRRWLHIGDVPSSSVEQR
jgi:hypothetical protein